MPTDTNRRFLITLFALLAALVGSAALFLTIPQVDLTVSGWFYDPGRGFAMNHDPAMQTLRHAYQWSYVLIIVVSLVLLVANYIGSVQQRLPCRFHAWVLAAFAIGPGLIVNLAFKAHWGRARPASIEEFGGPHDFTLPLVIADQCARNCSFSSGEGAAITTGAVVLAVLLLTGKSAGWRQLTIWVLAIAAMSGAGLRIIMGRHFLSDTVFSALICALVCLVLYRALRIGEVQAQVSWQNLVADIRALKPSKKT